MRTDFPAAHLLLFGVSLLAVSRGADAGPPPSSHPRTVTCSFSNPGYSGYCKQNAPLPENGSAQQVCQSILACLNDVQCIETYCNATTIRSNWKLESVEVSDEKK